MVDINTDTTWLALLGALFGGAGVKVIEGLLGRKESNFDIGNALREELRQEKREQEKIIEEMKQELKEVRNDVEMWREKYYSLLVLFFRLQSESDDPDVLSLDIGDL